jgi:Protein of unknown function (DUF3592)
MPDPLRRYPERWMSNGQPTSLVRDGRKESRDPVPGWKDPPPPSAQESHPRRVTQSSTPPIDDIGGDHALALIDSPQAARSYARSMYGSTRKGRVLRVVLALLSLAVLTLRLSVTHNYPPVGPNQVVGLVVAPLGINVHATPATAVAVFPTTVSYTVHGTHYQEDISTTALFSGGDKVIVAYDPSDPARAHFIGAYTKHTNINGAEFLLIFGGGVVVCVAGWSLMRRRSKTQRSSRWNPVSQS